MSGIVRRLVSARVPLPPPPALLLAFALVYLLTGLIGHDPWKPDDVVGTGIVSQMLRNGHWWVPNLAGELFLEDGPLYYWIAAGLAWAASSVLELHDGARLASGALMLLALLVIRSAAREIYGRSDERDAVALALLGTLGLLLRAHENLPEVGMLAAHAIALFAIALARRRPVLAGVLLGAGWGAALLCKGLGAALIPVLTAVVVPAVSRDWRTRRYGLSIAIAAAVGGMVCAAWLLPAATHAPEALEAWLAFQAQSLSVPTETVIANYGVTLSWAAWPTWPIALWILWAWRRRLGEAGLAFPLAALLITAAIVAMTPGNREVNVLPLLLPLALLAGAGTPQLRRGAASALAWFGAMTFSFFGALVWLGWFAMMTGIPAQIQRNFAKLEPGHVPQFEWHGFAIAAVLTLAWLLLLLRSERSVFRSVSFWAAGVTLLWGLVMTLYLDYIDYGRTYRPVALALKRALPAGAGCIESRNLGEAQRAAFDYHAGIVTRRAEVHGRSGCPVMLVQAHPDDDDRMLRPGWKRIWEGSRPRDKERYRLYLRQP
jgi:4-amino-4-deoxy-L-arabinose transferase-like glycosyltransferase